MEKTKETAPYQGNRDKKKIWESCPPFHRGIQTMEEFNPLRNSVHEGSIHRGIQPIKEFRPWRNSNNGGIQSTRASAFYRAEFSLRP
ncbi:hypothetical protein FTO70_11780 [Methanosarcina sp. KYL-1]|nr:hypothetical protein [Methanosarcina sp. KYL-1]